MRFDKFTTKFQQALADAQSLAVGHDKPVHRAAAPAARAAQPGGRRHRRRSSAGRRQRRARSRSALDRCDRPPAQGRRHARRSQRLARPRPTCSTSTDKEAQKRGDQFIASELFLLAARAGQGRDRPAAQAARRHEARRSNRPSRRCAAARPCTAQEPKAQREALKKVHARPHRARARRASSTR